MVNGGITKLIQGSSRKLELVKDFDGNMNKVALIIIFNHRYDKNIEVLENIYSKRFSHIYHLVPFYNGDKSNVIPVYENSYYFQGYVAQGFKNYFKEEYTHYFFIADDLLLNPIINEHNYQEFLGLRKTTCFLPEIISLHESKNWWVRVAEAYKYKVNQEGIEVKGQLPDYETALQRFKKFGWEIKPLRFNQVWRPLVTIRDWLRMMVKDQFYLIRYIKSKFKDQYILDYPLVGGYSDIFIVSSDAIKNFCHYCGIFSASKLFVEFGLPTALVLSAEEIVTEGNLVLQGKPLWTKEDYEIIDNYEYNLSKLLADFPKGYLYLHPVKLSRWSNNG
jgi:hypothetical protein